MTTVRDYSSVTELPGGWLSALSATLMVERYGLTVAMAEDKDVLELSCGSGQGLGAVAAVASRVVGLDLTWSSIAVASKTYAGRLPVVNGDAHDLPFADNSFDLVTVHEAIYYFASAQRVLEETRRVLRPGGTLVVTTVNPEWVDFNPSAYAVRYWTCDELHSLLAESFPRVRVGLGSRVASNWRSTALSSLKRLAIRTGLLPKTMHGKRWLKRLAYGRLVPVPKQIPAETLRVPDLEFLSTQNVKRSSSRVIYAIAEC